MTVAMRAVIDNNNIKHSDDRRANISNIIIKKVGKWMSLCCTVGYKWVTV